MSTVKDYIGELQASRTAACELMESSSAIADGWTTPMSGGEGEAGWTPFEVAQHMVYGDWWLVDGVAQTCLDLSQGTARPELQEAIEASAVFWSRLRRDQKGGLELSDPKEAAEALRTVGESVDAVMAQIRDDDLPKTTVRARGPTSIAERLQGAINHTNEHLTQLRELKG